MSQSSVNWTAGHRTIVPPSAESCCGWSAPLSPPCCRTRRRSCRHGRRWMTRAPTTAGYRASAETMAGCDCTAVVVTDSQHAVVVVAACVGSLAAARRWARMVLRKTDRCRYEVVDGGTGQYSTAVDSRRTETYSHRHCQPLPVYSCIRPASRNQLTLNRPQLYNMISSDL